MWITEVCEDLRWVQELRSEPEVLDVRAELNLC